MVPRLYMEMAIIRCNQFLYGYAEFDEAFRRLSLMTRGIGLFFCIIGLFCCIIGLFFCIIGLFFCFIGLFCLVLGFLSGASHHE